MSDGEQELRTALRRAFQHVLNDPTRTYPEKIKGLRKVRSAFHDELGAAFGPILNAILQDSPQSSIHEKRALCADANESLKLLGLCMRDDLGRPAILVSDVRSADDDEGRFRLEVKDDAGRLTKRLTSPKLPALELMEAPVRIEGRASKQRHKHSGDCGRG